MRISILMIVATLIGAFDCGTTAFIFETGGYELNPYLAGFGIFGISLVHAVVIFGAFLIQNYMDGKSIPYSGLVYVPIILLWGYAFLNNLVQIAIYIGGL